jgi:hypothetical protein
MQQREDVPVEREILDEIFQRGSRFTLIDAPPGAGKTYLIETIVSIAVERYGWRVAVVTPRRGQALDLARRVRAAFPRISTELLIRSKETPDPALALLGIRGVNDAQTLSTSAGLVTSTVDKFATTHEVLSTLTFDLLIFDEAYQTNVAKSLPILTLARRFVVVGDPGQLEPITQFPVERFEAAEDAVHHALPRFLLEKNPSIAPFRLRVTRRLPPDTVPFVQAFYPEMSFSATAPEETRRVSFSAAGMGDPIDRVLDKVAAGASMVMLMLPAVSRELQIDTELSETAVEIARRISARGGRWAHEDRALGQADMMYVDTHVASQTTTHLAFISADIHLGKVGTPEVIQGLESPIVIARHPLSGVGRVTPFDLAPGRLCVMLSRHQLACILLCRADLPGLLTSYEHDCGVRLIGREDEVWRGFEAARSIYDRFRDLDRIVYV